MRIIYHRLIFLATILVALGVITGLPSVAHAVPKVQEVKTPAGITAWLIEDHTLPMVTLRIAFRDAGLASDPSDKVGLSTLAAALLDEGAGDRDALAFQQALEGRAIELSADTSADLFAIDLKTLSEQREEAGKLLADALLHPRFDKEAIERVRATLKAARRRAEENDDFLAVERWQKLAFGDHPYSRVAPVSPEGLDHIDADDLRAFMKASVTRRAMVVSVSGDIDAKTLAGWLDGMLAALPEGTGGESVAPARFTDKREVSVIERDQPQTAVAFGLPGVPRSDPGFQTAYLLNYVLGGNGLTSRFGKEVRGKGGLTYHIGSEFQSFLHGAVWAGRFSSRNAQAREALSRVEAEMARIAKNGVDEKELQDAKAYLIGSFPLMVDTAAGRVGFLTTLQVYGETPDYFERREGIFRAITAAQVNAMAKRVFLDAKPLVVMVGKPEVAKPAMAP